MKKYEVWVNFSGCAKYVVEAESSAEAREIALSEADAFDCDEWDYELDEVSEIDEED